MISTLKGKTVDAKLWIPVEEVESEALTQLRNIASLPLVAHVSVMPDVHFGKGATVGSVIAMRGAVCPAAVGVDIGCGMMAIRTSLTSDRIRDKIAKSLFEDISNDVPVGFSGHDNSVINKIDGRLGDRIKKHLKAAEHLAIPGDVNKIWTQMGSLGGGNHFIEVCLDQEDRVWIMLHSGSRNIGKTLAEYHINIAKKLGHNSELPDRDLATFLSGTPFMDAYRHDLYWAQEYARLNRYAMLDIIKTIFISKFPAVRFDEAVECHHNYVAEEVHFDEHLYVTRKGAIFAGEGALGIIPGSMGTRSYIVRGKGNPDSLNSASHGAGRKMSRGKAKSKFTKKDLAEQTKGVICRKDQGVLDEIPGAYKKIEKVMEYQQDLVEIIHELKQIICVKG